MRYAASMGLAAVLALFGAAAPAGAAPEPVAHRAATPLSLVRRLAKRPPTRTAFAQARYSPLLDQPLMLEGELAWDGGQKLERRVEKPYREHTVIDGTHVAVTRAGHDTKHYSLDRAPAMKALLDGLVAVLSGDPERLRGVFGATLQGRPGAFWTLLLVPRDPKLAGDLDQLTLDGYAGTLRCIEIHQDKGEASIYVLGALAAQITGRPAQPALEKLCRAG